MLIFYASPMYRGGHSRDPSCAKWKIKKSDVKSNADCIVIVPGLWSVIRKTNRGGGGGKTPNTTMGLRFVLQQEVAFVGHSRARKYPPKWAGAVHCESTISPEFLCLFLSSVSRSLSLSLLHGIQGQVGQASSFPVSSDSRWRTAHEESAEIFTGNCKNSKVAPIPKKKKKTLPDMSSCASAEPAVAPFV